MGRIMYMEEDSEIVFSHYIQNYILLQPVGTLERPSAFALEVFLIYYLRKLRSENNVILFKKNKKNIVIAEHLYQTDQCTFFGQEKLLVWLLNTELVRNYLNQQDNVVIVLPDDMLKVIPLIKCLPMLFVFFHTFFSLTLPVTSTLI